MTVEEMIKRKAELGYTNKMIAEKSGVPFGTVQKVFAGTSKHPRYGTMTALEKVLRKDAPSIYESDITAAGIMRDAHAAYGRPAIKDNVLRDASAAYKCSVKKDGEYTLEDYYALPDEKRVELIDGVFYDMASPNHIHQILVTSISQRLSNYISEHKGSCITIVSPMDVQLDCDDRTMVQPDILVICDKSKFNERCIYGAPDLIIEVLSPGTRRKDMILKLGKYEHAEVREYWLVDPDKKQVITFFFDCEEFTGPAIYSFDDKVPIGIFGGTCEIDFAEIYDYISFLY